MKSIALIPARGGSKGIPKKNIALLNGRPLIHYTIEAAVRSKQFERIIVSTDCDEIALSAKKASAEVFKRPQHLATDSATTDSVISNVIEQLTIEENFAIVLLQPTSPLRSANHILDAMTLFKKKLPQMVMSTCEPGECIFKAFKIDAHGYLQGYFGADFPFKPRQEFDDVYMPNGAIYIFSKEDFLKTNKLPREKILPFQMNAVESIDIDKKEDLIIAGALLSQLDRA